MLVHIRYQEKNQLCDQILAEMKFSSLMPRGLAVPNIKQQRRGMIGLTLNNISDQFSVSLLFFKKVSCLIFWPALIRNLSCIQSRICSVNCFLLKRALAVLTPLLESLSFLLRYLFVFFIFELFFTISLPEESSNLFLAVSLSLYLSWYVSIIMSWPLQYGKFSRKSPGRGSRGETQLLCDGKLGQQYRWNCIEWHRSVFTHHLQMLGTGTFSITPSFITTSQANPSPLKFPD